MRRPEFYYIIFGFPIQFYVHSTFNYSLHVFAKLFCTNFGAVLTGLQIPRLFPLGIFEEPCIQKYTYHQKRHDGTQVLMNCIGQLERQMNLVSEYSPKVGSIF
uniref:Uncharacterized protein n=1 Tax=Cacopsylla melanoneura TaxID=428564 RepID=A0A8D9EE15_9HEMI